MTARRALWVPTHLPRFALCVIALLFPQARSFPQAPSTSDAPARKGSPEAPGSNSAPAKTADAKPAETPSAADGLIEEAINRIAGLESVDAKMVETVEILNQKFTISGRYLKAPAWRMYLQLTVDGIDEARISNLQVCDGETLWNFQKALDWHVFTKVRIKPVLERLVSPDLERKTKELAITEMGFAGTESLLTGVRKHYSFDVIDNGEETIDGNPVRVLHGAWKNRAEGVPPESHPVALRGGTPPFIAGRATLYLGKSNYWPYKLILAGEQSAVPLDTRRRGVNGEPIGARSSIEKLQPTRIVITYSNVKLNIPISIDEFKAPAPKGAAAEDRTDTITKKLDDALSVALERKKRDSARDEQPFQPAPIEIEIPSTVELPMPR